MGHGKNDKRKQQRAQQRKQGPPRASTKPARAGGSSSISKIEITDSVEEQLIRLLCQLDGGDLDGDGVASRMLQQAAAEDANDESIDADDEYSKENDGGGGGDGEEDEDDDDEDEDDDEDDDDDDDMDGRGTHPVTPLLTDKQRRTLVRKLIRDDRRRRLELAAKSYSDKNARKAVINGSATAPSSTKAGTAAAGTGTGAGSGAGGGLPVQYREVPAGMGTQVRLSVSCEHKKSAGSKLTVVDRTESLEALTAAVRKKFNAPQKYADLVVMPSGDVLRGDDLFALPDGTHVVLRVRPKDGCRNEEEEEDDDDVDGGDGKADAAAAAPAAVGRVDALTPPDAHQHGEEEAAPAADEDTPAAPRPDAGGFDTTPRAVGDTAACEALAAQQARVLALPSYQPIAAQRAGLPIHRVRGRLLEAIRDHPIVVVSGETGSGKTTQLPAYIYEDLVACGRGAEAYIVCTQPRRIAAMSVAERVAFERQEAVGNTVGYQVRLNSRCSAATRIMYCTTGVLLRRLQQDGFLAQVSHIVVDEVHERQVETDFLMTLLKQQAPRHPHLRLVMMSATMQEGLFADYFRCPIVYVEGRTFPVQQHYLAEVHALVAAGQREVAVERGKGRNDAHAHAHKGGGKPRLGDPGGAADGPTARPPRFDAEIIAEAVIRIIQKYGRRDRNIAVDAPPMPPQAEAALPPAEGAAAESGGDAVLVFLSGIQAIDKVGRALRQRNLASLNAYVVNLHGSLPPEQQRRVFKKTQPGTWKIVLATNIAETSVTLDDVTHVVDCGLVKELRYDPKGNMSSLQEVVISRASARQRAGRAGRVRPGHCWRLYAQEFLEGEGGMDDHPTPEIRRVPLEEVVLQVLLLQLGLPEQFLSQCLEPPSMGQIRASVACLLDIKAIHPRPTLPLTALGCHLARMPVDVRVGKTLIMASLLGCLEPALTVAAALAGKSPFFDPPNQREEAYRAHTAFTSSHNYRTAAAHYGVAVPDAGDGGGGDGRDEALTPPNHVFFSDHLATVNAYDLWAAVKQARGPEAAHALCRDRYLSHASLEDMHKLRAHFRRHLADVGFCDAPVDGGEENDGDGEAQAKAPAPLAAVAGGVPRSSAYYAAVRCALCAGLFPQVVRVARVDGQPAGGGGGHARGGGGAGGGQLRIAQGDGVEVSIHPSSLTHKFVKYLLEGGQGLGQSQSSRLRSKDAYIVYHKKVATGKVFLHDCTAVPAAAVLLFGTDLTISRTRKGSGGSGGGGGARGRRGGGGGGGGDDLHMVEVRVGGWIVFKMSELHAVLYRRLRDEIDDLLQAKVESPHADLSARQHVLMKVVDALIS